MEFGFAAGKTMHNDTTQVVAVFPQYRDKILVCITLMQKKR